MSETRTLPPQHQERQPGLQRELTPQPRTESKTPGSDRLKDRVLLVTGGDSGIGRAVAVAFAREGADVSICHLDQHQDAEETRSQVEGEGRRCLVQIGDVGEEAACQAMVERVVQEFGRLDILVNNAGQQQPCESIEMLTAEQLEATFRTNIFSQFFLTKAALPHLEQQEGAAIINTASVTAYKGNPNLLDYSATKGAIVSFTRSLA
ncbi:MAG: SDR family NAD(P)-dependent oxidoreductase, partial [Candidatus Eremiobacteraeota bacterium]|nr:SDR family NAD(P)-dependent oxidoreductase [Candidatus Eremiobacteraeota bacterium]